MTDDGMAHPTDEVDTGAAKLPTCCSAKLNNSTNSLRVLYV